MTEADLGRILEDQGAPKCGLVDTLKYAGGVVATVKTIARERARVPGPIVFDGLNDDDCRLVAEAIVRPRTDYSRSWCSRHKGSRMASGASV